MPLSDTESVPSLGLKAYTEVLFNNPHASSGYFTIQFYLGLSGT